MFFDVFLPPKKTGKQVEERRKRPSFIWFHMVPFGGSYGSGFSAEFPTPRDQPRTEVFFSSLSSRFRPSKSPLDRTCAARPGTGHGYGERWAVAGVS